MAANQIQLLMYEGHLGSNPEMRYTPGGKAVTNFRIASNQSYTNAGGEKVQNTTWLKVTAWGRLGEIINQYCKKGSHVIVTGVLKPGENGSPVVYETKSGQYGASYEVTAKEIRILDGFSDTENGEFSSDSEDAGEMPF